jgi:hypothetical protein
MSPFMNRGAPSTSYFPQAFCLCFSLFWRIKVLSAHLQQLSARHFASAQHLGALNLTLIFLLICFGVILVIWIQSWYLRMQKKVFSSSISHLFCNFSWSVLSMIIWETPWLRFGLSYPYTYFDLLLYWYFFIYWGICLSFIIIYVTYDVAILHFYGNTWTTRMTISINMFLSCHWITLYVCSPNRSKSISDRRCKIRRAKPPFRRAVNGWRVWPNFAPPDAPKCSAGAGR